MGYGAAIGGLLHIAGSAVLAGEAEKKRKKYLEAVNLPGLDIGAATGEALDNERKYLDRASGVASDISAADQAALLAREEASLPGIGAARQKALARIGGLFDDEASWLQGVQRRGAALGLSSGLRGSLAGQLGTLHLSDQEQMARTSLGTGLLGSLIGSMRIANSPSVQAFLGPTANQVIDLRSQERATKQKMLGQYAGLPTSGDVWGGNLQWAGATLMGGGLGGGNGISGTPTGNFSPGPSSGQQSMMMQDYYGGSNMGSTYNGQSTGYGAGGYNGFLGLGGYG